MFCTKCGKELYEGDRFCAFCGAEVRSHGASKNDDIVFNPPFKLEAQKKTEEILKATEERREEEKKAKRETVAFDWNLEGFPTAAPKKTEDVDFNWDSVLEKRSRIGSDAVYSEKEEPVMVQEPTVEKIELPETRDEAMPVEELEKELFGSLEKEPDDRFYTFNQKNNAFQELLDKEKERVQSLEDEYNKQLAEMDYTWVPDVFPAKYKPEPVKEVHAEPDEEPVPKTPEPSETEDPVLIGVVQPQTPQAVDLTKETEIPPCNAEKEQTTPSDKEKLRYSDIFPRVDIPSGSSSDIGFAFDEEEEEPVKKHTGLKILIAILIIALVLEGIILAIKFFAPDSKASQMVNDVIFKVADIFTGGSDEPANDPQDDDVKSAYISGIVTEKAADVKTIGSVIYNPQLVYDKSKAYSFDEIASADEFVDAEWKDASATYGEKLIETIIKYYDGWIDTKKDKSLVGINTLEIGEIKTGQSGFYTLCKVTYAGDDGSEISDVQTVYTVISNGLMVINEIKEEVL